MATEIKNGRAVPSEWTERVSQAMDRAVKKEVAKLRQMKLPIIVSQNGKPVDINPDTNPDAPPWKD